MNKTQSMSHTKLSGIPIRVVREYPGLEWTNFSVTERNGEWEIRAHNRKSNHSFPEEVDSAAIRDGFLAIRDANDAVRFFRRTGHFSTLVPHRRYEFPSGKWDFAKGGTIPTYPHVLATMSQIRECQRMIRELIVASIGEWPKIFANYPESWYQPFNAAPNMQLQIDKGAVMGTVLCSSGLSTIAAGVIVEKLKGLEFRFCARWDCGRLYRLESRHSRKFCSVECAHLEAVRNSRLRKPTKVTSKRQHK